MKARLVSFFWIIFFLQLPALTSWASEFQALQFGVTERFTFQKSHSGANLSTMPSWNPSYRLSDELEARGFLGVTGTNSTVGDMIVTLAQLGVAYHSPHLGRFFPEALLGAEFWSRSEGGVYTAGTFNVHYSLKLGEPGTVLGALSTATIGYSVVRVPARTAHHATLGLRFSL